jgi:hypothetical protein
MERLPRLSKPSVFTKKITAFNGSIQMDKEEQMKLEGQED